mmetsp:Transcript_101984/g.318699  ORF Transcript_101984/g.318699 Transcript_101984/m.318699 type:complete len:205 (+) Transcript_101984:65-679(+)
MRRGAPPGIRQNYVCAHHLHHRHGLRHGPNWAGGRLHAKALLVLPHAVRDVVQPALGAAEGVLGHGDRRAGLHNALPDAERVRPAVHGGLGDAPDALLELRRVAKAVLLCVGQGGVADALEARPHHARIGEVEAPAGAAAVLLDLARQVMAALRRAVPAAAAAADEGEAHHGERGTCQDDAGGGHGSKGVAREAPGAPEAAQQA